MASAVIGALRAILSINTAAFDKGLKGATGGVGKFQAVVTKSLAAVAVAATGVATAIGVGMRRSITEFDKLAKTSSKVGLAVQELQQLRHAADLTGVSSGTLDMAMQRFSRRVAEAAQGTGELKDTLAKYNIEITDSQGRIRSQVDILRDLADRIAGAGSAQEQLRIAFKAFDSEGAALVNTLKGGSAALNEMMMEATALGIVIDDKTAAAAERFTSNLARLGAAKDGIITQLTAHMLPAFEALSQHLVDAAMNGGGLHSVVEGLKIAMDAVTRAVILVWDNMAILVRVAASFIAVKIAGAVVTAGLAFVRFAATIRTVGIMLAGLNIIKLATSRGFLLQAGLIAALVGQWDNLRETVAKYTDQISELLPDGVMGSVSTALKALGIDTRALELDLRALGTGAGTDTAAALEQLNLALNNTAVKTAGLSDAQERLNELEREGAQLTEAMRTPQEALAATMERLRILLAADAIGWQTYQRAATEAAQGVADAHLDAVSRIIGGFQSMAQGFAQSSKKMATIAKALGIVTALINAYKAASEALQSPHLPWPLNIAAAAAALATGLGYVASIRSQSIPSFAHGGSFIVGGSGGTDSQLVQLMASPNEMVTIETPEQQRRGGGETVVIQTRDPWSREMFRDFARKWQEHAADGVGGGMRLVVT